MGKCYYGNTGPGTTVVNWIECSVSDIKLIAPLESIGKCYLTINGDLYSFQNSDLSGGTLVEHNILDFIGIDFILNTARQIVKIDGTIIDSGVEEFLVYGYNSNIYYRKLDGTIWYVNKNGGTPSTTGYNREWIVLAGEKPGNVSGLVFYNIETGEFRNLAGTVLTNPSNVSLLGSPFKYSTLSQCSFSSTLGNYSGTIGVTSRNAITFTGIKIPDDENIFENVLKFNANYRVVTEKDGHFYQLNSSNTTIHNDLGNVPAEHFYIANSADSTGPIYYTEPAYPKFNFYGGPIADISYDHYSITNEPRINKIKTTYNTETRLLTIEINNRAPFSIVVSEYNNLYPVALKDSNGIMYNFGVETELSTPIEQDMDFVVVYNRSPFPPGPTGFTINLYHQSGEVKVVHKESFYVDDDGNHVYYLDSPIRVTGTMRMPCDEMNPVVVIEADSKPTQNYAYIPIFNRYYFISDRTCINSRLYALTLTEDVLTSAAAKLTNADNPVYGIVARQEKVFNPDLPDEFLSTNIVEVEEIENSVDQVFFNNAEDMFRGETQDTSKCAFVLTVISGSGVSPNSTENGG